MARKNPAPRASIGMPHQDKHDKMMGEMHSALYALGDKLRKPFDSSGEKLLPKALRATENPEAQAARKHVEMMHKTMKKMGS